MTVFNPRLFYDAVKTRLAAIGKQLGDNIAPADPVTPYSVLYDLDEDDDPDRYGTLAVPHEATRFYFQVTSVGKTATEARWMQHAVRAQLLGWTPTVSGLTLGQVERDTGDGIRPDLDAKPVVFYAVDRYRCFAS